MEESESKSSSLLVKNNFFKGVHILKEQSIEFTKWMLERFVGQMKLRKSLQIENRNCLFSDEDNK